jgi:hypothetical protein
MDADKHGSPQSATDLILPHGKMAAKKIGSLRCNDRAAQRAVSTTKLELSPVLDTRVVYCATQLSR